MNAMEAKPRGRRKAPVGPPQCCLYANGRVVLRGWAGLKGMPSDPLELMQRYRVALMPEPILDDEPDWYLVFVTEEAGLKAYYEALPIRVGAHRGGQLKDVYFSSALLGREFRSSLGLAPKAGVGRSGLLHVRVSAEPVDSPTGETRYYMQVMPIVEERRRQEMEKLRKSA